MCKGFSERYSRPLSLLSPSGFFPLFLKKNKCCFAKVMGGRISHIGTTVPNEGGVTEDPRRTLSDYILKCLHTKKSRMCQLDER